MKKYFGGSHLYKKRKSKRPLDFGKLTHLVLRLKDNQPAFFSPRDRDLRRLLHNVAAKYSIQIEELIFNHTHIHSAIAIKDRQSYRGFIRELSARIVVHISKNIGIKLRRIFASRPFTRIVSWGRGLLILRQYMKKNEEESGVSQCHWGPRSRIGWAVAMQIKSGTEYWAASAQLDFFG